MIWAALFAGIAGYVDAICYLRLGGAFAANMTGNLVEVGIAAARGKWPLALWCAGLLFAFLIGVLAARLVLREHSTPRVSLLIEAAMVAAAATGLLASGAVALLAAAMGVQNEAVTHGIVAVNVAFVTGDIQQLGEQLLAESREKTRKSHRRPWIILIILASYAAGAAVGTLAAGWGAGALFAAVAALVVVALLPSAWTGSDAYHDPPGPRAR